MGENQSGRGQTEREPSTDRSPTLCDDRLYRALASTRRRRLLYVLLVEEECRVEKLATVLAGWDATETGTMTTADARQEILVELVHAHLPRLAEDGLVAHDRENDTVRIEPLDESVVDLISQSVESEQPAES